LHEPSDELAEPFHAVLDERIVLAIDGSGIHAERVLNVAFKDRLFVEGVQYPPPRNQCRPCTAIVHCSADFAVAHNATT
jgi:hypothetical protein